MHLSLDHDDLDRLAELVAEKLAARMTPSAPNDDRLLTEAEAAQLCRVQPHTLRDARRRGVLASCKAGRFRRYRRADLEAWLNANK